MVFTSSTNNTSVHPPGKCPKVLDETVFSDFKTPGLSPYAKSMMVKEKTVWDFVESKKVKGEYCPEIVALLPCNTAGEIIPGIDLSTTYGYYKLLNGDFFWMGNPYYMQGNVSVADVAMGHLRALEVPEAAN